MASTVEAQTLIEKHKLGVASLPLLTDDLDLESLPERLDDTLLERVDALARSPLPPMIPCGERHFSKCLRIMLAVLPRQSADELSGELFVAAYQRKLGHLPDDAISYIADKAMERCRWFPTIAECLEIASGWNRIDEYTKRKARASEIASRERSQRRYFNITHRQKLMERSITQAEIDKMNPEMIELGISCGALVRSKDGTVRPYLCEDPENPFGAA